MTTLRCEMCKNFLNPFLKRVFSVFPLPEVAKLVKFVSSLFISTLLDAKIQRLIDGCLIPLLFRLRVVLHVSEFFSTFEGMRWMSNGVLTINFAIG